MRWFLPAWVSGRPAIEVEVREPHVQLVQDFNGVNLANLEFDEETVGDTPTVRLQVGAQTGLSVSLGDEGLQLRSGDEALKVKSDNAWAIEAVNGLRGCWPFLPKYRGRRLPQTDRFRRAHRCAGSNLPALPIAG